MGILDDILKGLGGAPGAAPGVAPGAAPGTVPSPAHQSLATDLLGMLAGGGMSGGLAGLVNMFNQKGLGEIVSSWVSTGRNLPISPDQIQHVLGSSQIQALAAKAGIDPQAASAAIAQILPHLVDKATPDGQVPTGGGLQDILKKMMG